MAQKRVQRRLAAILAADVVGYSRLIRADEEGTLARLKALREELIDPGIAKHDGRIVKTMGDGVLVEFPSVVDAVRNAVQTQKTVAAREADVPEDRRIVFRMGINLGDVVIDGDDILGDGVNVAARLEGLADPGGVCVSGAVYDQVRDRMGLPFEDLGDRVVKNIDRPVRVWRWPADVPAAAMEAAATAEKLVLPDKPSIAVLPFDNLSGDPEQEYFADGIAEDIITALSRFRSFFVIARNSSFTYKGRAVDLKRVATELGVRYIVEGSVRKAGNRVRITAQLIDAPDDRHVWAERYDRDLEDIFAVQDEITGNIVASIAPNFVTAEVERAQRKNVQNLDAWDCIMRARWHTSQFTKEDWAAAQRLLVRAADLDPKSAWALSEFAFIRIMEAGLGWAGQPSGSQSETEEAAGQLVAIDTSGKAGSSISEAGEAARRAVALDARDAQAHAMQGFVHCFGHRHSEAVRSLDRAIDINPNFALAYAILGFTRAWEARVEEAFEQTNKAFRLDPHDPFMALWRVGLGIACFTAEKYEEAASWAERASEERPGFPPCHRLMASAYGQLGRAKEAGHAVDRLLGLMPDLTVGIMTRNLAQLPFKREADMERYLDGLRKAGLPE